MICHVNVVGNFMSDLCNICGEEAVARAYGVNLCDDRDCFRKAGEEYTPTLTVHSSCKGG